jgi:hypothetical protein
MSSSLSPLDAWLAGENSAFNSGQLFWDPGFDAERRVVISKLGPYHKLFERPENFIPRFFHRVYALPIEDWHLITNTRLYGGFCTMTTELQIHFQATLKYVERNRDTLPEVNRLIKTSYESVVKDIVNAELSHLNDGKWVQAGLAEMERQIESVINETLILKHIQCRTICALTPVFAELTDDEKLDGRFTQESIYLNVMQKHFEFREKQNLERFRQEEELELLRLEHQQKLLETINQDGEIQRKKQTLEAETIKRRLEEQEAQRIEQHAIETRLHLEKTNHETHLKEIERAAEIQYHKEKQIHQQQLEFQKINQDEEIQRQKQVLEAEILKRRLEEQEAQRIEQYAIETRLHEEKTSHEMHLKEIELAAEIQHQEEKQIRQQQLDLQKQAQQLEHERLLKELKRDAEMRDYEQERVQWLQGKEQEQRLKQLELEAELKEQEIHQLERQKIQERLEAEKIKHQIRLHEMQLEAEIKELEMRAEATKNKDEYLRREIEWLVLDKQRAELTRSIRQAVQDDDKL